MLALGLKTLVSLHQAVNPSDVEALTADEVTIIGKSRAIIHLF